MRVEEEGCDTESGDRYPEVDEVWDPDGHGDVEEHDQHSHAHVDTRPCESGVEDTEGQTSGCETSTSGDIASTTEGQVGQDGVGVDLRGEDFEDR